MTVDPKPAPPPNILPYVPFWIVMLVSPMSVAGAIVETYLVAISVAAAADVLIPEEEITPPYTVYLTFRFVRVKVLLLIVSFIPAAITLSVGLLPEPMISGFSRGRARVDPVYTTLLGAVSA